MGELRRVGKQRRGKGDLHSVLKVSSSAPSNVILAVRLYLVGFEVVMLNPAHRGKYTMSGSGRRGVIHQYGRSIYRQQREGCPVDRVNGSSNGNLPKSQSIRKVSYPIPSLLTLRPLPSALFSTVPPELGLSSRRGSLGCGGRSKMSTGGKRSIIGRFSHHSKVVLLVLHRVFILS